jgi:hypothetical protein
MPKTCPHLEPLEVELTRKGVELQEAIPSPYGPDWGLWSPVACVFEASSLRIRLGLPDFILFDEYDGRVAGSDATFYCPKCKRAIMGVHPNYARASTPGSRDNGNTRVLTDPRTSPDNLASTGVATPPPAMRDRDTFSSR